MHSILGSTTARACSTQARGKRKQKERLGCISELSGAGGCTQAPAWFPHDVFEVGAGEVAVTVAEAVTQVVLKVVVEEDVVLLAVFPAEVRVAADKAMVAVAKPLEVGDSVMVARA